MEMTQDPGQQLYPGLYGEVVTEDCYGIRDYAASHDPPDVIFDIGANVGIFTRFAREVFPDAFIVAVEPDEANFRQLVAHALVDGRIDARRVAIGDGPAWQAKDAVNGPHEMYVTPNPGYSGDYLVHEPLFTRADVDAIPLARLVTDHVRDGQRYLVKLDCEGNENAVFADRRSVKAIARADYFAIEVHTSAAHGGRPMEAVRQLLTNTYDRLEKTHAMVVEHATWRGTRRASVGTGKSFDGEYCG